MPEFHLFLRDLAVVLGTAAVTTVVFQRLRQSVVLGYLLAGMLVGPHVPFPLVAREQTVRTFAELGVILLIFGLGLEFSFRRLLRVGAPIGLVTVIQTGLMLSLGYLTGQLLGWSALDSVFAGAIICVSSTVIIARVFDEQRITGRLRELVVGILVAEDLVAIVLIASLSAAAVGTGLAARDLVALLGRLLLFLGLLVGVGLYVVPPAMRAIVRLRRDETTLIASVGLCFACALLADSAGYSVALGAFVAGSLIAESGAGPQVERLVHPVRDIFAAIFFVSIGMLLDPRDLARYWPETLLFTAVVVGGKITGTTVGSFLAGYGARTSLQAGMSMAQIGEFSFIIAGIGIASGAVREELYAIAVTVSVLTAFATPWLIRWSDPFSLYVDRRLPKPIQTFASLYGSWLELLRETRAQPTAGRRRRRLLRQLAVDALAMLVIIIGTAVSGSALRDWLMRTVNLTVAPARLAIVGLAAALVLPFAVGLARTSRALGGELAEAALPVPARGVDQARAPRRALQVTLQIAIMLAVGVPLVALTQPFLPPFRGVAVLAIVLMVFIIAFWRSATDLEGHTRAGAELVVHVLAKHASAGAPLGRLDDAARLLPGLGAMVPVRIPPGSPAVGQSLGQLNIRGRTGATAVAVSRGQERIPYPGAREVLEAGDIVALSGTQEACEAAARLLDPDQHRASAAAG